jgi:hypothetical protein
MKCEFMPLIMNTELIRIQYNIYSIMISVNRDSKLLSKERIPVIKKLMKPS